MNRINIYGFGDLCCSNKVVLKSAIKSERLSSSGRMKGSTHLRQRTHGMEEEVQPYVNFYASPPTCTCALNYPPFGNVDNISSYLHIYGAIKVNNPLITYNSSALLLLCSVLRSPKPYRDFKASETNRIDSQRCWAASCSGRSHFSAVQIASGDNNGDGGGSGKKGNS